MRRIIDNVVCDTETARYIASATVGKMGIDDKYYINQTYKTKDGHYFQYIEGNYNPDYKDGKIILLSKEAAAPFKRCCG